MEHPQHNWSCHGQFLAPTPNQVDRFVEGATEIRFYSKGMVKEFRKDRSRMEPYRISIYILSEKHSRDCLGGATYRCYSFMDVVDTHSHPRHLQDDCIVQLVFHRTERRFAGDCSVYR